jgi:soluble lytic murein transglycosylase-like protein
MTDLNEGGEMHARSEPPRQAPGLVRGILTGFGLLLVVSVLVGVAAGLSRQLSGPLPVARAVHASIGAAESEARAELASTKKQVERATRVLAFANRFDIPVELSASIYDATLAEGITPELGYRLVQVESRFLRGAASNRGALGLTQVRLPTARSYIPGATKSDLRNRDVNLRVGFRYLRDLLRRFDGDLELALVAYNRGPTIVDSIATSGGDPSNGYADMVLAGVRPATRAKPTVRRGS